jgi:hypothetical protein
MKSPLKNFVGNWPGLRTSSSTGVSTARPAHGPDPDDRTKSGPSLKRHAIAKYRKKKHRETKGTPVRPRGIDLRQGYVNGVAIADGR